MLIENSIQPTQPVSLRNANTHSNHHGDSFHDILRRSLNSKSNSRPPMIELTGLLVPCNEAKSAQHYRFKLETDSKDYLLSMNNVQKLIAEKIQWEEVTVRGHLENDSCVFEVERISIAPPDESYIVAVPTVDSRFELQEFIKAIAQHGKVEPDYLAS